LKDFLKSRVEYETLNVTHWKYKFRDSDDEKKGDWPGEQKQEAFRTHRSVELYDLY